MSLSFRLRAALLTLALLLTAVVGIQLAALRQAAASEQALRALAERHRIAAIVQPVLLDGMQRSARKFVVTRDTGYLAQLTRMAGSFEIELRHLVAADTKVAEAPAVDTLRIQWKAMDAAVRATAGAASLPEMVRGALRIDSLSAGLVVAATRVATASQDAMSAERAHMRHVAQLSARVAMGAAIVALVLGVVLSLVLVRSIARPIERIAAGARAVAAGQLEHRIDVTAPTELAGLARDFNAMTMRLAEVDQLKRDFLSNVSHDLKTPLSSMQETTDVLLDGLAGPITEKQRQLLQYHRESGMRLASMLAKLLDLSRLESRRLSPHAPVDLSGLLRRAVEHMRAHRTARPDLPTLEFVSHDEIAMLGDAEGIVQVLDNLLENASKFSPADGVVRITLRHSDGMAVLTVADEGPGVPDADKDRVFDRFHQTPVGRAVQSRGVGLGLAICREVVTAHGGTITVRDNARRGAVFEVRLPGALAISAPVFAETDLVGVEG